MCDTKKIIANGFLDLAKRINPDKITVIDICKHSNVSRETFYYHFTDKYDLFKWIYQQSLTERIRKYSYESSLQQIIEKVIYDAGENSECLEKLLGKASFEYSEITYETLYNFYYSELSKSQPDGKLPEEIEAEMYIYLKGGIEYFKHYYKEHTYRNLSKLIANAIPEKLALLWKNRYK